MKIYNFSRVLAIPFAIVAGLSFYYGFDGDKSIYTNYLVPSVLILAIIYIFHNNIDFWYRKKFPIRFDKNEVILADRYSPFYNKLSDSDKIIFEERMHTFIHAKEFKAMGREVQDVPHDVQFLTGLMTIEMTFSKELNFRLDHFDQFIFYKHPFPSPRHQYLHTTEVNAEDGVIIMALDYVSAAINDRKRFYHTGYHTLAEAYIYCFSNEKYPIDIRWESIEQATKFRRDQIIKVLGTAKIDLLLVAISTYFVFSSELMKVDLELWTQLDNIFRKSKEVD